MFRLSRTSVVKTFVLAVVFAIVALACNGVCHDAGACHATDESDACVCLCHSPMTLLTERVFSAQSAPGDLLACETLVFSTLLPADIFRPPAC